MLDPKVLNLLEMAERGELPKNSHLIRDYDIYTPLITRDFLIYEGRLTYGGECLLKEHRYERLTDTTAQIKPDNFFKERLATESDLTAIHSQLGELKYKVEKLEGCTKSCTCSCTKPEQPALEWEVWYRGRLPKFMPFDWEFGGSAFKTEKEAIDYANKRCETFDTLAFEVRHNPNSVNKER